MNNDSKNPHLYPEKPVGAPDGGLQTALQTEVRLDRMNEICDRLEELKHLSKSRDSGAVGAAGA